MVAATSWADPPSATKEENDDKPIAELHWQPGPLPLDIGHDIHIQLPEHYVWLGMPDADKLMRKLGNFYNTNLLGVIVGDGEDAPWLVSVRYTEDGHVDDSEKIDADELLKTIKEGTEEANEERVKHGMKPAHVESWSEAPRYERDVHHLVWALVLKAEDGSSLNYSTRVLGRRGVVALNLITPPERLVQDRVHSVNLLKATAFKAGSRYEDFDKSKDKTAEYGLMGLILGGGALGAAKLVKIGLLAKFWKVILTVLIAGKKAVIAFFVLIYAGIKRMFGKGPKPGDKVAAGAAPPPPANPPLSVEDPKLSVDPPSGTGDGGDKPPGAA